ncbi:zinc ribbon domain-containing protein [SCandidatus Aminicenantes bacterium Aminicenantia_JdfR_composite]|jgi:putative FmdB family regulatory protein|nr:zinc ribbon domain-containing protein [SCandidatus Aminicenantes bacterium Aminicenantia_JdfR_composite]MCP2606208.1 zinc ribbon domain-containing protein [Candidatus Aminicenantes bacterium AC-708-I09]
MPLYEYRCSNCGETFEVIQKFNQPLLEKCSKCGGKLTKLLSPPMIQFKGSGWYVTDYAKKTAPSNEKGDKKQKLKEKKESPSTQASHHPPFAD